MEPRISEFSKFGRNSKMAAADRKLDLDRWGPPSWMYHVTKPRPLIGSNFRIFGGYPRYDVITGISDSSGYGISRIN